MNPTVILILVEGVVLYAAWVYLCFEAVKAFNFLLVWLTLRRK